MHVMIVSKYVYINVLTTLQLFKVLRLTFINRTKKMRLDKGGECIKWLLTAICDVETPWAQDMNRLGSGEITAKSYTLYIFISIKFYCL